MLPLLVVTVAAATWWVVAKPQAVFIVRVHAGRPLTIKGKVTGAFLATVDEVFREFGLQKGEIRGVRRGRRLALWFSGDVPPNARQRLRNWWSLSGW